MKLQLKIERVSLYLLCVFAASSLIACSNGKDELSDGAEVEVTADAQHKAAGEDDMQADDEDMGYTDQAMAYLTAHAERYELKDPPAQLSFVRTDREQGFKHVHLQQVHASVPVFESRLIVHFDKHDAVYRVSGKALPVPPETGIVPKLTAAEAGDRSMIALGGEAEWKVTSSRLVVYSQGKRATLAYHVTLHSGLQRQFALIDANNGSLIKTIQGSPSQGTPSLY